MIILLLSLAMLPHKSLGSSLALCVHHAACQLQRYVQERKRMCACWLLWQELLDSEEGQKAMARA